MTKESQMYMLTGMFLVILLVLSGLFVIFNVLLCIVFTLVFHLVICTKNEVNTKLSNILDKLRKKL